MKFKQFIAKMFKKKRIVILLFAFFVVAVLGTLKYRKAINDVTSLSAYRLSYDDSCESAANELKGLCKDQLGVRLHKASGRSHLFLYLANNSEKAQELGFSLNGYEEEGYLITRYGNGLYLLSNSDAGLKRAVWQLTNRLVDTNGKLLILQDQKIVDFGNNFVDNLQIINKSPADYSLVYSDKSIRELCYELDYFFVETAATAPVITRDKGDKPYIELSVIPGNEKGVLFDGDNILIRGSDINQLRAEIKSFANTYLGWMNAGTANEKLLSCNNSLNVLPCSVSGEPWIPQREAIVTLWNTNYSRGVFYNNSTTLKTNLMTMSDEQLYQYVQMLKYCGFNGIQFTDMCSAWAGAGSYEFVHDRLRTLAEAAHSLDMKVTLWVWGSEFTGYGWVDNSVKYSEEGCNYAHESEEVRATFEKYYNIYAELADVADRVIGHFVDPGNLTESEDVAYFSKMLKDIMLSKNPDIDFGVSCWIDTFDKRELIDALGTDITIYEGTNEEDLTRYEPFRAFCRNAGCRLGTWAWDTCEMEIDQLAQVNFNPHVIQSVYHNAREYDSVMKPSYWSEMDSNHVVNVFSLYCAGHLLMNPDLDLEELTKEVAYNFVGDKYADDFAEVLKLIEAARSGESWDTYWWGSPNYILKSDSYSFDDIAERSAKALSTLETMIENGDSECMVPMPLDINDVLKMLVPQVKQIQEFADFRKSFSTIDEKAVSLDEEDFNLFLYELCTPISEYNTVTGLWGQIENRAKQEMVYEFCKANGYEMPEIPYFRREQKNRIYNSFVLVQKGKSEPVYHTSFFQGGFAYGYDIELELVDELVEEGLLSKTEDGKVYLTDWEHYRYAFN